MYFGCLLRFIPLLYELHIYCDNSGISTKYLVWGQIFRGDLVSRFHVNIPPWQGDLLSSNRDVRHTICVCLYIDQSEKVGTIWYEIVLVSHTKRDTPCLWHLTSAVRWSACEFSFCGVVFLLGHLLLRSTSCDVIFLCGPFPLRSSSLVVLFL